MGKKNKLSACASRFSETSFAAYVKNNFSGGILEKIAFFAKMQKWLFPQRKGIVISEKVGVVVVGGWGGGRTSKGQEIANPVFGIPRHNGGPLISKKNS